jgi:hypothetical protein
VVNQLGDPAPDDLVVMFNSGTLDRVQKSR